MFLLSCPRSFHPLLEVEIDFHKDIYIYKIVERGWRVMFLILIN